MPDRILLVEPPGRLEPETLAAAVVSRHPHVDVTALRVDGDGLLVAFTDGAAADDERSLLLRHDPLVAEWRVVIRAVRSAFDSGVSRVVVLWVGAVAVAGPLEALLCGGPDEVALVGGAGPTDPVVPVAASFGSGSLHLLAMLDGVLAQQAPTGATGEEAAQRALEVMAAVFGASVRILRSEFAVVDPVVDIAGALPGHASMLVLTDHDGRRSWAEPGMDDELRQQLSIRRGPLRLVGGSEVDAMTRATVFATLGDGVDAPAAWRHPASFRSWLGDRYWDELRRRRPDLRAAFALPDSADAAAFAGWSHTAFVDDTVPFLVSPRGDTRAGAWRVESPLRADGVNLVGFVRRELGLGDDIRRLVTACADGAFPASVLAYERSASPLADCAPRVDDVVAFDTSLAVITAAQFPVLRDDHHELFAASQRMIGYWMWEIEQVPRFLLPSLRLVDEVWTGSQFIVDAFRAVTDVPVRHVPIPVPEPQPSVRSRAEFPPLADAGDRTVLLVVLDHLSVTERKNPVGAIRAFRQAFSDGEGPLLVVKTTNAQHRWPVHQRLRFEAEGRSDIRVWDAHLTRPDQMALVASSDCLVSLHRGEGLGLHLAESMWLGTPVIATRYSGNLDFMDDGNSLLIDATLVPVRDGEGIYPDSAVWAEPDLADAADAMRRVVASPELRVTIAGRARARMAAQPSLGDLGRRIAELVREG